MYARLQGRSAHQRSATRSSRRSSATPTRSTCASRRPRKGLRVSRDLGQTRVAKLIRRHAEVVSLFIANGMPEMMKSH